MKNKINPKSKTFERINQQSGRLDQFILFIIIMATLISCGNPSRTVPIDNSNGVGTGYTFIPKKANGFYVLTSSFDEKKLPRNVEYLFNGMVQNNTGSTFAKGTITMQLSIELENGNILQEKDLNDMIFSGISAIKSFDNWKPGGEIEIDHLRSISIPVQYVDYPVKDVTIDYLLDAEDQINNEHEEKVIASISAFDSWKQAVIKVKANKVDANEHTFPELIFAKGELRGDQDEEQRKSITENQIPQGTTSYCDAENLWNYKVALNGSTITFSSYPGKNNTLYIDKTKEIETISGIIKDGKIVTEDPPGYKTNRFKFESDILYELNKEGEYNEYKECR